MSRGEARALLYDILADRTHLSCNCAACRYAAYHRSKMAKGRTYAKRIFFLFDLWQSFTLDLLCNLEFRRKYEPEGHVIPFLIRPGTELRHRIGRYRDPESELIIEPGETIKVFGWTPDENPAKSAAAYRRNMRANDLRMAEDFKREVRDRTRSLIMDLMETERTRKGKTFLGSYLKKKSFYIYYRRAQDPDFMSTFATGLDRKRR